MNPKTSTEWTENEDGTFDATLPDGTLAHVWQDGRWYFALCLTCGLDLTDACGDMRADTAQTAAVAAWEIWKRGEKNA